MSEHIIKQIDRESVTRICSGQVVVDLTTAVKELVENALDAGASTIEVKLWNMGVSSFEVSDNGRGIDRANYGSIALNHTTSKLREFSDLTSVTSFGFRGEALHALCELSGRFSITTKQEEEEVGTALEFAPTGELPDQSRTLDRRAPLCLWRSCSRSCLCRSDFESIKSTISV